MLIMTAEVAILNRQAIALAADSAVTVSGPSGQKIFNTVNKLFALSKYHPVGIMVYSSAEVMGVPVETVVKSFRNRLGEKSFATLEDYHDEFIRFLTDDTAFFSEEARVTHSTELGFRILRQLYNSAQKEIFDRYPGWKQPTKAEAQAIAVERITEYKDFYGSGKPLKGSANARTKLRRDTKDMVDYWRGKFSNADEFGLSDAETAPLINIALDGLLKTMPTNLETGFVIAGFGDDEIFPQLRSFEFESSVYGVHKWFPKQKNAPKTTAQIIPFAQTEMIETFVAGRALSLDGFLENFINEFFEEQKSELAKQKVNTQTIQDLLDTINENLVTQFSEKLQQFTKDNHVNPLMNTVASMPKEELAAMAEALINLTAIKRRLSPDAETVGGPTDVAIISKGDGFVWIKRKHYFDKEINAQFGYNYNRKDKEHEETSRVTE